MQPQTLLKSSDELTLLYHQLNKELTAHLLEGASWDEQQNLITMLSEISKELTRRKFENQNDTKTMRTKKD